MAHVRKDRVKELTTTTGTGALSLAGAVVGFQAFAAAIGVGNTCEYVIVGPNGAWETGLGTLSAALTLQRTTVYESSNAGAAVSLPVGSKEVFVTLPASRVPGDPPAKASTAEVIAGTDDAKFATPKGIVDAMAFVAFAANAINLASLINGKITLTAGATTFAAPTNAKEGQTGVLAITQDGTGGRTGSWNTFWDFGKAGVPTLSAGAGKTDIVTYVVMPGAASARCSFGASA